mgnify:CR=1 FL=1
MSFGTESRIEALVREKMEGKSYSTIREELSGSGMSEKEISIGHYFVASGVYTVFGVGLPVTGAPVFQDYIFKEFEKLYGGMWDLEVDPVKHARKMIAHIDKKRKALGIDRSRERVMVDMATRREMSA